MTKLFTMQIKKQNTALLVQVNDGAKVEKLMQCPITSKDYTEIPFLINEMKPTFQKYCRWSVIEILNDKPSIRVLMALLDKDVAEKAAIQEDGRNLIIFITDDPSLKLTLNAERKVVSNLYAFLENRLSQL